MVTGVFDELALERPRRHFTIGINDDVSLSSLPYDSTLDIEPRETVRAIFFGLGSDGTVGANKIVLRGHSTAHQLVRPASHRLDDDVPTVAGHRVDTEHDAALHGGHEQLTRTAIGSGSPWASGRSADDITRSTADRNASHPRTSSTLVTARPSTSSPCLPLSTTNGPPRRVLPRARGPPKRVEGRLPVLV